MRAAEPRNAAFSRRAGRTMATAAASVTVAWKLGQVQWKSEHAYGALSLPWTRNMARPDGTPTSSVTTRLSATSAAFSTRLRGSTNSSMRPPSASTATRRH